MKYRTIGQGLTVSAIGLGCMPMRGVGEAMYGVSDDAESIATIHAAIDMGVTFFDTAEIYGPHQNELLLARGIKGKRDKVKIATKFGFRYEGATRVAGVDGSPANVRRACEGCLKRLETDHIDLFYQHRMDPNVPIEDTVGAMAELVKEGKVRYLGLSEAGASTLRRAHAVHPITALQSEYSVWERNVEKDVLPVTAELGIGFIPYSPLGRGFLTGAVTDRNTLGASDWRRNDPRFDEGNFEQNLKILDQIRAIATAHKVSLAQIALAWLLAQRKDIVPIPGSKRRATMSDSMGAADVELTPEEIRKLNAITVAGARYREAMLKTVNI